MRLTTIFPDGGRRTQKGRWRRLAATFGGSRGCGSEAGRRQGPARPGGSCELGRAEIPPRWRPETQRKVPGCVLEAGADVDGADEVVDEPLVLGLPTWRQILAPGPSTKPARIGLSVSLAQELQETSDPAIQLDVLIEDLGVRLRRGQGDCPASEDLVAVGKPLAQLPGQLLSQLGIHQAGFNLPPDLWTRGIRCQRRSHSARRHRGSPRQLE